MPKAAACICCLIGRAERVGFMNKYDGYWIENKRSGFGVLTKEGGEKYEGYFENDKKNGKGL